MLSRLVGPAVSVVGGLLLFFAGVGPQEARENAAEWIAEIPTTDLGQWLLALGGAALIALGAVWGSMVYQKRGASRDDQEAATTDGGAGRLEAADEEFSKAVVRETGALLRATEAEQRVSELETDLAATRGAASEPQPLPPPDEQLVILLRRYGKPAHEALIAVIDDATSKCFDIGGWQATTARLVRDHVLMPAKGSLTAAMASAAGEGDLSLDEAFRLFYIDYNDLAAYGFHLGHRDVALDSKRLGLWIDREARFEKEFLDRAAGNNAGVLANFAPSTPEGRRLLRGLYERRDELADERMYEFATTAIATGTRCRNRLAKGFPIATSELLKWRTLTANLLETLDREKAAEFRKAQTPRNPIRDPALTADQTLDLDRAMAQLEFLEELAASSSPPDPDRSEGRL